MRSMHASEYQALALITEFTPDFVRLKDKDGNDRDHEHNMMVARALHAHLGLVSEAGEIADALKKHIIYSRELDLINVFEEAGDVSWYVALLLSAVKRSMGDAFERNIAKLKKRFGDDKFTTEAVNNRDLAAERRILEGKEHGG